MYRGAVEIKNRTKHVNGWLDRRGKFYPCRFNKHLASSIEIEKKLGLKHSIEYLGWIKVHDAGVWFFEADSYQGRQYVKITEAQNKWLFDNGYEIRR